MTDPCIMCGKPAVKSMTWVNASDSGVGSGPQGGAMCEPCMELVSASLDRFPAARETLTIWPLRVEAAA